ncbi:MAG: MerR family transcriptional regulator [Bacillota bacterium]|nr:MerR family transcriptional regulator [Candidatus Fermentithermobacillaceae bacterium]
MAYFHGPDEPVYTISVAARLLGETPQFLRQIENEGLISPARTDSNIRLYSSNDLRLLARIIYLWRQCGINPQGIRVIIAMEEGDSDSRTHVSRRPQDPAGATRQGRQSADRREATNGMVKEAR